MVKDKATREKEIAAARLRERTPDELARLDETLDNIGPLEFFRLMVQIFGTQRTTELVGWAVIWGLMGVESVAEMRHRYEETGLKKSSAYRAAADFKKFGDYVLGEYGRELEMKEIIRRLTRNVPVGGKV